MKIKRKEAAKPAKKTAAKKTAAKTAAKKPRTATVIEFGVPELAKEMGIEAGTIRLKLRETGVKKSGKSYDFGSADGLKKMAKKLAA